MRAELIMSQPLSPSCFTLVCVDLLFWVFGLHYVAPLQKKRRAFPQPGHSSAKELTEHERCLSRLRKKSFLKRKHKQTRPLWDR